MISQRACCAFSGFFRYPFQGETVGFFLGLKAGYQRLSSDIESFSNSQNGFKAGPQIGIQIPLSGFNVEIAAEVPCPLYLSMGDAEVDGDAHPDSDSSGVVLGATAGISIPIGS